MNGEEGLLVLIDVAVDCVGCTNPVRPPPDHIVVPRECEFGLGGCLAGGFVFGRVGIGLNVPDHPVDQRECFGPIMRAVVHQPIVGARAGLDQVLARLRGQGCEASLMHQVDEVTEQCRLNDFAVQHAVEFCVTEHGDFARGGDAKEWLVKEPH